MPKPVGRPPHNIDLDKLTEYASQDIDNKDIAKALGMSVASFYNYMKQNENFRNAYQQGMENRKFELEKALYKRAAGYHVQEKRTVTTDDPGKGQIVQKTVTEKNYVPDTTALIFTLSNIMPDKYKQRGPEAKLDVNININDMRQLPTEELEKILSNQIVDAIDYQIE